MILLQLGLEFHSLFKLELQIIATFHLCPRSCAALWHAPAETGSSSGIVLIVERLIPTITPRDRKWAALPGYGLGPCLPLGALSPTSSPISHHSNCWCVFLKFYSPALCSPVVPAQTQPGYCWDIKRCVDTKRGMRAKGRYFRLWRAYTAAQK